MESSPGEPRQPRAEVGGTDPAGEQVGQPLGTVSRMGVGRSPATTPGVGTVSAPSQVATVPADESEEWASRASRAFALAQKAGTPEAWQDASDVAEVLVQVAETMRVAADASLDAERAATRAREAAEQAAGAERKAEQARRTVQETARAAQSAADEAKSAERLATEARQTADLVGREAPKAAEAAKIAAEVADEVGQTSKGISEIVARARSANTPEAWKEACALVGVAPAPEVNVVEPQEATSPKTALSDISG